MSDGKNSKGSVTRPLLSGVREPETREQSSMIAICLSILVSVFMILFTCWIFVTVWKHRKRVRCEMNQNFVRVQNVIDSVRLSTRQMTSALVPDEVESCTADDHVVTDVRQPLVIDSQSQTRRFLLQLDPGVDVSKARAGTDSVPEAAVYPFFFLPLPSYRLRPSIGFFTLPSTGNMV